MLRLGQSGVESSGYKTHQIRAKRDKSRDKIENKSVVRRSDRGVRKLVRIRAEQSVKYRTTQREDKTRSEKVDKKRQQSTQDYGR